MAQGIINFLGGLMSGIAEGQKDSIQAQYLEATKKRIKAEADWNQAKLDYYAKAGPEERAAMMGAGKTGTPEGLQVLQYLQKMATGGGGDPGTLGAPTVQPQAAPGPAGYEKSPHADYIRTQAEQAGLDPAIFLALGDVESRLNPDAYNFNPGSSTADHGLYQINDRNLAKYGITNPYDPTQNVPAAAKILRENLDRFGGSYPLAISAYQLGPARVADTRSPGGSTYQGVLQRIPDLMARAQISQAAGIGRDADRGPEGFTYEAKVRDPQNPNTPEDEPIGGWTDYPVNPLTGKPNRPTATPVSAPAGSGGLFGSSLAFAGGPPGAAAPGGGGGMFLPPASPDPRWDRPLHPASGLTIREAFDNTLRHVMHAPKGKIQTQRDNDGNLIMFDDSTGQIIKAFLGPDKFVHFEAWDRKTQQKYFAWAQEPHAVPAWMIPYLTPEDKARATGRPGAPGAAAPGAAAPGAAAPGAAVPGAAGPPGIPTGPPMAPIERTYTDEGTGNMWRWDEDPVTRETIPGRPPVLVKKGDKDKTGYSEKAELLYDALEKVNRIKRAVDGYAILRRDPKTQEIKWSDPIDWKALWENTGGFLAQHLGGSDPIENARTKLAVVLSQDALGLKMTEEQALKWLDKYLPKPDKLQSMGEMSQNLQDLQRLLLTKISVSEPPAVLKSRLEAIGISPDILWPAGVPNMQPAQKRNPVGQVDAAMRAERYREEEGEESPFSESALPKFKKKKKLGTPGQAMKRKKDEDEDDDE